MKTSFNVEITSEAEYKMLIEKIYIEIKAQVGMWEDKYRTAFKENKIIERKDKQAFYDQLKKIQALVEKTSDQLKDKGIDVTEHTEKLKKYIVDLTFETPDELQEMKNRAEIYSEIAKKLYPMYGKWNGEVIKRLKCKIFVERRLGDLYGWNKDNIRDNLKALSHIVTQTYLRSTIWSLKSYKTYLENLRDKFSHNHNPKDLNSGDRRTKIEEEIVLTIKALEIFNSFQQKLYENPVFVRPGLDEIRKSLPEIIENWKNEKIGENSQELDWENEKTEESLQELDSISLSRSLLSPVERPQNFVSNPGVRQNDSEAPKIGSKTPQHTGLTPKASQAVNTGKPVSESLQIKDKSIKKPWYRKVADWIEGYIPFLGKLFNKILDKLCGKESQNQSVILKKTKEQQASKPVQDVDNVSSIKSQNNPAAHGGGPETNARN